ncbi:hypothetical protein K435DRAFT_802527 [Dendrothele bispora CBS 962.96]|uniref:DUF6532 domain-containing protein n=1 Tax=Dendrothele bispora (strain CBS 962.96) TaxID=1314807 RepID=A0A4S8LKK4_DENBC|nr:hypothetical protein K435DRAFT_802527 [Dendrothele bispora CBS 962.96]
MESITIINGLFLFKDAFVEAAEQLKLCNLALTTACSNLQRPHILYRIERDQDYRKHLTNYIFGRVTHMRGQVKVAAQKIVEARYGLIGLSLEQRKTLVEKLLEELCYIFPLTNPTDTSTWQANRPYRHIAVAEVLNKAFFKGRKAIGKQYESNFTSVSTKDTAKELPKAMVALAGVALFAALKEWKSGSQIDEDFSAADMKEEYDNHIQLIDEQIMKKDGSGKEKYHNLMAHLYCEANKTHASNSKNSKLPKIDFDGMEIWQCSFNGAYIECLIETVIYIEYIEELMQNHAQYSEDMGGGPTYFE